MRNKRSSRPAVLFLAALSAAPAFVTRAASTSWTFNGNGNWTLATNWNNGAPISGSDVFIRHNDAINRLIAYDYAGASIQFNSLTVENTSTGVNGFLQGSNTFNAFTETVGNTGTGYWDLAGGTHNVTAGGVAGLAFGSLASGKGIGTLTGGTLNATGEIFAGYHGNGAFTQSGGQLSAFYMTMGWQPDGVGTYNLSAGSANVTGGLYVGYLGTGSVNLSGGTLNANSEYIASGSAGVMNQTAGVNVLSGSGQLYVGYSSTGTYLLSGTASLTVNGAEIVGFTSGANGNFNQMGGIQTVGSTLTPGTIEIGEGSASTGSYSFSGGSLTVSGTEIVGDAGTGTFNQSGGSQLIGINTFEEISIGATAGGVGTYILSDGSVTLHGIEYVGALGNGTFIQSGGTQTINGPSTSLDLGALGGIGTSTFGIGTYQLSGGSLNAAGSEEVGNSGAGTFIQTGGTNIVGTLAIQAALETSALGRGGAYLLSGGTLTVYGSEVAGAFGGGGIINQSGGVNVVGSVGAAGTISVAHRLASAGTFLLSNTASLTLFGTELVGDVGAGTFNQSGGSQTIGDPSNQGTLTLGYQTDSTGTYLMSGGTLTVNGIETIGQLGVGTFIQSGGTHTVGSTATAGSLAVARSQYLLSGTGVLNVNGTEIIGAAANTYALFDQQAGTHTIGSPASPGTMQMQGFGRFQLEGGTLTVFGTESLGGGTPSGGYVYQAGGTHTIGSAANPGLLAIDGGYFDLEGGTLAVNNEERLGYNGTGTLNQGGGVHTIGSATSDGTLEVGYYVPGIFQLAGNGSLTVHGTEYIGISGNGTFLQTGGTHQISGAVFSSGLLVIGGFNAFSATGVYQLDAGTVNVDGFVEVGGSFGQPLQTGILNIPGGAMSVGISLDVLDGYSTAVNLSGGALSVGSLNTDNNPSRFNWTAGTLTITGANGLDIGNTGPLGLNVSLDSLKSLGVSNTTIINSIGQLTLNGGTFTTGGLIGSGHLVINSGTFQMTAADVQLPGAPLPSTLQLNTGANIVVSGASHRFVVFSGGLLQLNGGAVFVTGTNGSFGNLGQTILSSPQSLISSPEIDNAGQLSGTGRINGTLFNQLPSGTVSVGANDTLLFQGASNFNFNRFTLGGGTIQFIANLTNSGTISGAGSLFVGTLTNNGTISALTTISVGSLSNAGTVQLSGGQTNIFGPVSNLGRILITGGSTTTFYGDVNTSTGSISVGTNSTAVFFGNVTGQSHFSGAGIKDFEGAVSGGPIASIAGDTYVGTPANVTTSFFNEDDLSISGNAAVATDPGSGTVSRVHTLEFFDNGKLDLNNNDLLIDYTGASPLATVVGEIKTGYANGAWTGNLLTSTSAHTASLTGHPTALGYAEASALGLSTFDGQSIDGSTIIIRYTLDGDANLDGIVNALDFNALATSFGAATGELWHQGDFNYDGAVNTQDFTMLASNFNQILAAPALVGDVVPEPVCVCVALPLAITSRRRRARRIDPVPLL